MICLAEIQQVTNDVYGIYFTAVDALSGLDNIVTNNVIYNIKSNGIIYGLYNAGSDNILYYHNTISLDDNASTTTDVTRGFYQTTSAAGIVLRNNIFTLGRGGTGIEHGLYFNTRYISYHFKLIMMYSLTHYLECFLWIIMEPTRRYLADWQTATGQDANSFSNDPIL